MATLGKNKVGLALFHSSIYIDQWNLYLFVLEFSYKLTEFIILNTPTNGKQIYIDLIGKLHVRFIMGNSHLLIWLLRAKCLSYGIMIYQDVFP